MKQLSHAWPHMSQLRASSDHARRLNACDDIRRYLRRIDLSNLSEQRKQVLESFAASACMNGYAGVSMRSLAVSMRISTTTLRRLFPKGKDQVATQALRWHLYRYASEVLHAVEKTRDVESYWESLVHVHLQRQLTVPENELWNILMASDRFAAFLPAEAFADYHEWCGLYERIYAATAYEIGYTYGDIGTFVKVLVKVLDTANEWCHGVGTEEDLRFCVGQAVMISRALMGVDLGS